MRGQEVSIDCNFCGAKLDKVRAAGIREGIQFVRAYRYTKLQSQRAGNCADYRDYLHTRIMVPMEDALELAVTLHAFREDVPY